MRLIVGNLSPNQKDAGGKRTHVLSTPLLIIITICLMQFNPAPEDMLAFESTCLGGSALSKESMRVLRRLRSSC